MRIRLRSKPTGVACANSTDYRRDRAGRVRRVIPFDVARAESKCGQLPDCLHDVERGPTQSFLYGDSVCGTTPVTQAS
jgi:hypothetical protein